MRRGVSLGRDYGWLWAAYAGSTMGTWVAFNAFPLLAITVLHEGTAAVAALAAVGAAVGAAVAVPLGPWVEFRRKRPVMIAMDLVRCAALLSVAVAYAFGGLGFAQLLVVSVLVAAADITFGAASGAFLKALVRPEDLLVAQARFESTTWTATVIGPPLGGALLAVLGPVATVVADALSYLLSAAGIRAIGTREERPEGGTGTRLSAGDLLEGWRGILAHPVLRPLFVNTLVVNGLIMATAPLLAVLMLGPLGFSPWQYGLAFAVPCAAGLIGSRLARPLVVRFGQRRVLLVSGALRACWPVGLVFIHPGVTGLLLVIGIEFALIGCAAVFTPVLAAHRLEVTVTGRVARTLTAWSVSTKTSIAAMTALGGALASVIGPRAALGVAGVLLLATPLLLPWAAGRTPSEIDTCKSSVTG
ncbi:MFS transporter [Streptomyces sp. NPDC001728]|uniref:MFS transporter n=1 Tax=Streptomyces sp. NPDC001728 TaxID=3154396 RepID=UPI003326CB9C